MFVDRVVPFFISVAIILFALLLLKLPVLALLRLLVPLFLLIVGGMFLYATFGKDKKN